MNDLKQIRTDMRLSKTELAEKVGCSRVAIFRWESFSLPNGKMLLKLAAALNVTPNELLGVVDGKEGEK